MQRSLSHAWAAVVTSVTLIHSRSSDTHTYTEKQVYMFVLFKFLSMPDSWWPNSDSLSLLIQSYTPTCILVCVFVCVYFFPPSFVLFSIPYRWLPNSLFRLDTGIFIWATTRCRPCHRTFLLGFPRFRECVFFWWLSNEILCLKVLIFYTFLTCVGLCF